MVLLTNDGTELGVANPVALALDPQNGKLYWMDKGGAGVPPKIGKANMDGSSPEVLVKDDLIQPEFMTLDQDTEMIYFSSSFEPKVKIINVYYAISCRQGILRHRQWVINKINPLVD